MLVDVPKDVAQAEVVFHWPAEVDLPGYRPTRHGHPLQVQAAAEAIADAERPVLYVGGGIVNAEASRELLALAEEARVPVVTTLTAKGAFPDSHPLSLQMPGMHGSKYANWALHESDLLIVVGARFDDRVTGKLDAFAPGRPRDPHGHRPGRDLEEPPRGHPDRRRAARRAAAADGGARRAARDAADLHAPRAGSTPSRSGATSTRSATGASAT